MTIFITGVVCAVGADVGQPRGTFTSHAAVSSHATVNCEPGHAHGTQRDHPMLGASVRFQLHRLDHRVLDPEKPPPYPRWGHAVPVLIVSDRGGPDTLDRHDRRPY